MPCLSATCTACDTTGKCNNAAACGTAPMYVDDAGMCMPCPGNCGDCDTNKTTCDASGCLAGFYNTDANACAACITGCAACSEANKCTTCSPAHFHNTTADVHVCSPCAANCTTCTEAGKCSTGACNALYMNNDSGTCDLIVTCTAGSEYDVDNVCTPCGEDCEVCGTDGACTLCDAGCGPDATDNKICVECTELGDNGYNCASDGTTITVCEDNYGLVSGACEECDKENCVDCAGNAAVCTECAQGFGLSTDGECYACAAGCAACFT